ncbi:MAG: exodeoxyribonuclease V subunit alpha, partial [Deferrisomatales bacterium]|nr:exodeoxyribonuclease V subunit alpha [Deferrisomatales bacterium]
RLAASLGRLFPGSGPDDQRLAALAAAAKPFCVISGGPGTGKTSTVVKVLALLVEQRLGDPPRIALAAPTGKAAARLMGSIRAARDALPCSAAVRGAIPAEVSTVHRLLGAIPGSPRFRHNPENPLPHDVVVVDEASMVALPLMARLVDALAPGARLVLVGDHRQLASVEAGAVLGDLCGSGRVRGFSPRFAALVARVTGAPLPGPVAEEGLPDAIVVLQQNYRFGPASGIGAVSRALWDDPAAALQLLIAGAHPDVGWTDAPAPGALPGALAGAVLDGYGPVVGAAGPAEALEAFGRFQLLCALRGGPYGVEGLNRLAEGVLAREGRIEPRGGWYRGRPVLVTRNDYGVGLFNGDVGIAWPDPARGGELGVFFPAPDGALRSVAPGRVPSHDTAYAMTVHKSQGSEFHRVLLVLPDRDSEVLTRELLYTGLTRARSEVRVWGRREVFARAAARRTVRPSGLGEKVWGPG